jgi:meromycolic acid enoyl-[acyl-carrier-protein] reductase
LILSGKRILVTGLLTRKSIAFHIATQAQLAGADVVLSGFGRARRLTERAARQLPRHAEVIELDVTRKEDLEAAADVLGAQSEALDGVVHSIAFAPRDALGGNFMKTPSDSAAAAFITSAYSLTALTEALLPLLARRGGSVVGIDFDAAGGWPGYDWMGVAKAALEATCRYTALYVGRSGVRVNLVASGPVATVSSQAVVGFRELAALWAARAPLGWDPSDPTPVGAAVCMLLSDFSRAITGEILYADGGVHATGGSLAPASPLSES